MTDINTILAERGTNYGKFEDHARLSQGIKATMKQGRNWPFLDNDMEEALEMVAHKIARILNGDPKYADSWVDIAGYAQLVANRLCTKN